MVLFIPWEGKALILGNYVAMIANTVTFAKCGLATLVVNKNHYFCSLVMICTSLNDVLNETSTRLEDFNFSFNVFMELSGVVLLSLPQLSIPILAKNCLWYFEIICLCEPFDYISV